MDCGSGRRLVGLMVLSAAAAAAPLHAADQKVWRIGHILLTASLPVYAAHEGKCFERENLSVELVKFGSSNEVAQAGVARQIDLVGAAATNAMLDAAVTSGTTARAFVFAQYTKRPDLQSTDFLVAQPGIASVGELKGRKVAFFPGTVSKVLATLTLPKYGLTPGDITLIEMPPAKWGEALVNKDVDAAHLLEPAASKVLAEKKYNVLIDGYWGEVQAKVPVAAAWFVSGSMSQSDEGRFYRAFECGVGEIEADPQRARETLAKFTGVDPSLAAQIRLLDYAMSSDASAVGFARSFVSLLQDNNATVFKGSPEDLIYAPTGR